VEAVARSVFECAKDAHFEVVADAFHKTRAPCRGLLDGWNVQILLPVFFAADVGIRNDEILVTRIPKRGRRSFFPAADWRRSAVSEQKVLLMLMLERSDPAGLIWISTGEVNEGALRGGGADTLRRRVGAGKMRPQMRLIAQPTSQPAIRGGNGKGEAAKPPDPMERLTLARFVDQREKMLRCEVRVGDEMTPQNREGAPASMVVAAIGTKKRMRLIS